MGNGWRMLWRRCRGGVEWCYLVAERATTAWQEWLRLVHCAAL